MKCVDICSKFSHFGVIFLGLKFGLGQPICDGSYCSELGHRLCFIVYDLCNASFHAFDSCYCIISLEINGLYLFVTFADLFLRIVSHISSLFHNPFLFHVNRVDDLIYFFIHVVETLFQCYREFFLSVNLMVHFVLGYVKRIDFAFSVTIIYCHLSLQRVHVFGYFFDLLKLFRVFMYLKFSFFQPMFHCITLQSKLF